MILHSLSSPSFSCTLNLHYLFWFLIPFFSFISLSFLIPLSTIFLHELLLIFCCTWWILLPSSPWFYYWHNIVQLIVCCALPYTFSRHPLCTVRDSVTLNILSNIEFWRKFYAMRDGKRVPKLNKPPDQHWALLRDLTTRHLKHGRIKNTRAMASAMRKYVDHKMITLAKDGSLQSIVLHVW